ncbi:MAG: ATP-binding protein [Sarcina sp.]|nr:ATP-binding protein [Sarcina sp.]
MKNPFTPTFGMVPPVLAGRKIILADMSRAFENWPGDPNLSSILIGPRGSGKTALLSCIGERARESGWLVVDTVAVEGMLEDILQQALKTASELAGTPQKKHLTGVKIGQIRGLEWTTDTSSDVNWRMRMETLLEKLKEQDVGLLMTVDEVRADVPEMIRLASTYQLFIREGAKVSLVMAGLPANVDSLISNEDVSFLRRSRQHDLARISDSEISRAFRMTIESEGKRIEEEALSSAVAASGGYPYMMQLVGFSMWEECQDEAVISGIHAERGISLAVKDFKNGVLRSTYRELSKGDRTFLRAILPDREFSRLSDVAGRMGKKTGYASTYKTRMLKAGVIEEGAGQTFSFAIPFFREYFQEQEEVDTKI